MTRTELDLDSVVPSLRRGVALEALDGLEPGRSLLLRTRDEPEMLLRAVNNHLRGSLRWQVRRDPDGLFEAVVSRLGDVIPNGIIDLLLRHHQSLDVLLSRALRSMDAGDAGSAAQAMACFADQLRRHVEAENVLLAPRLATAQQGQEDDPVQVMLREHAEILEQLSLAQCALDEDADLATASTFLAMLSGVLAKHEHREESRLFPAWEAALAKVDAPQREALFAELRRRLDPAG